MRVEYTSRIGIVLPLAARVRTIAISGTTPLPPPNSSTGSVSPGRQTNQPPIGPRSSNRFPGRSSSVRYGDTSPSASRSTVNSTRLPSGADAIE